MKSHQQTFFYKTFSAFWVILLPADVCGALIELTPQNTEVEDVPPELVQCFIKLTGMGSQAGYPGSNPNPTRILILTPTLRPLSLSSSDGNTIDHSAMTIMAGYLILFLWKALRALCCQLSTSRAHYGLFPMGHTKTALVLPPLKSSTQTDNTESGQSLEFRDYAEIRVLSIAVN